MSAEIICVGTELLLGEILNSNAQFLAQELAQLGIPHYFQTVVGDNIPRIHQVIQQAQSRSSILIFTGGLGPTPDDLTTEAIASFFQVPLIEFPDVIADIRHKFEQVGRTMVASNCKQALQPQGADILANPTGTAPGMVWQPRPDITILTFPGVPSEMKRMWQDTAISVLKAQGWGKTQIYSQMLRFRGIGESSLAEKVAPFFDLQNPTVAPYASMGEVRLRVASQAASAAEAQALIDPVVAKIQAIAGLDYLGKNDDSLSSIVGGLLRQRRETVGVAESCTAGKLGAMLTEVSGSSEYFWGGVIAYDNQVKIRLLGVDPQTIDQGGAVSARVAEEMALGIKTKLGVDWGLSITGIAGPSGGGEAKPVGLVYLGIAAPDGSVTTQEHHFGDRRGREIVRYLSACTVLDQLRRRLLILG